MISDLKIVGGIVGWECEFFQSICGIDGVEKPRNVSGSRSLIGGHRDCECKRSTVLSHFLPSRIDSVLYIITCVSGSCLKWGV